MSTTCEISPAALPVRNPLSSRWPFTRLQKLVNTPRFVSVDLADNISLPTPPVDPLPLANRPDRARLMPWRLD